jgi:TRAP-type C4-dicarboxylate transport system substrate-binding protein
MKRVNFLKIAFVSICAIGLLLTTTPVYSGTTVLRWAHPSPKRGFEPEHFEWIKKEVETRTEGRLSIEVFWGGALAEFKEMAESVKSGMADVGWISAAYHQGFGELSGVAHATSLFNPDPNTLSYMEKYYKMIESDQIFYEDFKKNNMVPISMIYYDEYWVFSKRPIKNIGDFKGLKIRGISEGRQVAMKAWGASPVFIGAGEMYSAIEKNIIDAVEYSPDTSKRYNIHEIAKYITKAGFQPGVAYWCINLDAFNRLSEIDQKILMEIGKEAALLKAKWMGEERERALATFKESGCQIIDFSAADKKMMDNTPDYKAYAIDWVNEKEQNGMPAIQALKLYCDIFAVNNHLKK